MPRFIEIMEFLSANVQVVVNGITILGFQGGYAFGADEEGSAYRIEQDDDGFSFIPLK